MEGVQYRYIDLSHTIYDGLVTYSGLPAAGIQDYWTRQESGKYYEEGTSFHVGKMELVGNTGTYIDTPFHRYENGKDLNDISLDQVTDLEGIVIHVPFEKNIRINYHVFKDLPVQNCAVLIHTGWDRFWGCERYFNDHPYVTEQAARYLADQKVKLVGIDSYNIDDTTAKSRPVHSILLKNDILIVEHMCKLNDIPDEPFTFSAIPVRIKGMGSYPVRAFARIEADGKKFK